jgi:hypothetical protein
LRAIYFTQNLPIFNKNRHIAIKAKQNWEPPMRCNKIAHTIKEPYGLIFTLLNDVAVAGSLIFLKRAKIN